MTKNLHLYECSAAAFVDRLGALRAEIKDLQDEAKGLEAYLKHLDVDVVEGEIFRASIARYDQSSIAWKAIAEALKPSRQRIAAHTTVTPRVRINVSAHLKGVA
jgi:hypothetical protein